MARPWARLALNFINHPKFLAISGNAISLWLEGKNYCDMHQTDGVIPREALKTFRFAGPKSIGLLVASCGEKPGGGIFQPLWKAHPQGYVMHDYLAHNDASQDVRLRMEDADDVAELRKAANRRRQAEFRANRKREIEALRNERDVTPTSRTPTETASVTPSEPVTPITKRREFPRATIFGNALPRHHLTHAVCGRVCLQNTQMIRFAQRLGGDLEAAKQRVRTWAQGIAEAWQIPPLDITPIGENDFAFWDARWSEWQPSTGKAKATEQDTAFQAALKRGPSVRP